MRQKTVSASNGLPEGTQSSCDHDWDEIQNYVDSLYSDGRTYHDIGMTFGARFIWGRISAPNNPSVFNDRPSIATYLHDDGILDTGPLYHRYGLEKRPPARHRQHISLQQLERPEPGRRKQRFLMACNAAKRREFRSGASSSLRTPKDSGDVREQ